MLEIVFLNDSLSTICLYTRLQAKDMAKDKSNIMAKDKSNKYNNYKTKDKPKNVSNHLRKKEQQRKPSALV